MSDSKIILIFVPPVKRIKINTFFKSKIVGNIFNLDTMICKDLGVESIQEVITNNSRETIIKKWEENVKSIFHTFKTDPKKVNVIICHPVYYNILTREFFSIFNSTLIKEKSDELSMDITHVAHLIDDIYDIFHRLTNSVELFGDSALIEFMERYSKSFNLPFKNMQGNPRAYVGWIQHCINSILNWRAQELLLTQNIAIQLNGKFMLWGIKQNPKILIDWLLKDKQIFYISHPISEPRRILKNKKTWPPLVKILNDLPIKLQEKQILSVMPTAIDEFRFKKNNSNYTSKLTERWPIPTHVKKIFKNYSILDSDQNKLEILAPKKIIFSPNFEGIKKISKIATSRIQEYVNSAFNTLEIAITESMANRDHTLVWHTDGIIVLEPYDITNNKIHGGVQKELDYVRTINNAVLANSETPRKLLGIFEHESIEIIINSDEFKSQYIHKLRDLISTNHNIDRSMITGIISNNSELDFSSTSLGRRITGPQKIAINKNIQLYQKESFAYAFLHLGLTNPYLPHIGILILPKKLKQIDSQLEKIKDFLIHDKKTDWELEIIKIAKKTNPFKNTKFY